MERVFVYGTLKRGFPLHNEGLAAATFLGRYRTIERYPMLVAGPRYAPMMLLQPGRGLPVMGELYKVTARQLRTLDELESVGLPGNMRASIGVVPVEGGAELTAQAFFKGAELARPEHSGFLTEYMPDPRFVRPR